MMTTCGFPPVTTDGELVVFRVIKEPKEFEEEEETPDQW